MQKVKQNKAGFGIVLSMAEKIVTRFAPSPTGLLHAGNYRTAIFAYLFAKKHGGKFIVRIEDTDKARSKKEYEENILETLEWLQLKPDTIYRQSDQQRRHQELLQQLIATGHAFVSKEKEGDRAEVIRFANPKTTLMFTDVIRGPITFDTTELGDFVVARSLTEPVFHFAVVVDDADEGVTHVIRGEDHISNTPRQILIQKALGLSTPTYAHLPLVLGRDRSKLSKRNGAKPLTQYRDEGFLGEALINYLSLVGWHPEGERELFTPTELIDVFNLSRIQKGAAMFDEVKLRWFNQQHLKQLTVEEFTSRLKEFTNNDIDVRLASLLKERSHTLKEAAELEKEYNFLKSELSYDPKLLIQGAKTDTATVRKHLAHSKEILQTLASFDVEHVKQVLFPYATKQGRAQVLWPLRVALSGKKQSPDPFTLAALLGKEKTLKRIEQAQKIL